MDSEGGGVAWHNYEPKTAFVDIWRYVHCFSMQVAGGGESEKTNRGRQKETALIP